MWTAPPCTAACSSARTASTGGSHATPASAAILYGIALEGTARSSRDSRGARRSSSASSQAATAGSSRKTATPTTASAAGRPRGRVCASTCPRLCLEHGVDAARLTDLQGRLPIRRTTNAARGPVLLVGDAAGLVDPLSGDGIYEALVSARLAATAILAGDTSRYEAELAAARPLRRDVLEGEARARPPSAGGVRARADPCGLARHRRAPDRGVAHPAEARGLARPPLRLLARL